MMSLPCNRSTLWGGRNHTMQKQVTFTSVRKAEFLNIPDLPDPREGQVKVRTLYSGISAGTEMHHFRKKDRDTRRYDSERCLFLECEQPLEYPRVTGYENAGTVLKTGGGGEDLKPGDLVFGYVNHVTEYVRSATSVHKLPERIEPKHGIFVALLGVAYNAILDARILLGETVVVFGLGVIGQFLIQLAHKAGAKQVIVVDLENNRLEKAKISGADVVLNPRIIKDVALAVRDYTENRGADVVIESSGSTFALQEAIRTACFQGRVIVVSYYMGAAKGLYLGEEFHFNRIRLISSQANGVNPELHPRWDSDRKIRAALTILPEMKVAHLISHEIPAAEAQKAYDLVDKATSETMQVILTY